MVQLYDVSVCQMSHKHIRQMSGVHAILRYKFDDERVGPENENIRLNQVIIAAAYLQRYKFNSLLDFLLSFLNSGFILNHDCRKTWIYLR